MNIVIGRGNSRKVYSIPCADVLRRVADTSAVTLLHTNLCSLLGIALPT